MQTKITTFFQKNTLDKTDIKIIKNNKENPIYIYTDGACKNNGKKNAIAGIGVYIKDICDISERIKGKQTNQRAELYAILKALESINIKEYNPIYIIFNCICHIFIINIFFL